MGASVYFTFACVIVGTMILLGLGLLFVRATNIERPNLVAACTLVASLLACFILWNAAKTGLDIGSGPAWSAITLSLFGFVGGRVWDAILGGRRRVHHDEGTLGADLSD